MKEDIKDIKYIEELKNKVLSGYMIEKPEAMNLINIDTEDEELMEALFDFSKAVKEKFNDSTVNICSIMSGRVGACSEDCKFCAQSVHNKTDIEAADLPSYEEFKNVALSNEKSGVHRMSLVSSGKGATKKDLEKVGEYYRKLSEISDLHLCASLGILSVEELEGLRDSGVKMYHHNIETSRNYYKDIVSTHSFDDRIKTIENAKKAGLRICSGGIIGMGESLEDRVDFILELRELEVDSVPVNILDAIPGTPFENKKPLSEKEILKTLAVFRIAYPKSEIRYAGGRKHLADYQKKGLEIAVNGMLSGDFLTTVGNNIAEDIQMIDEVLNKNSI